MKAEAPSSGAARTVSIDGEVSRLILRRLRAGAFITLPFVIASGLGDFFLRPEVASILLALKLIPLAACAVAVAAARRHEAARDPRSLAAGCVLALGLTGTLSAVVEGGVSYIPILMTSLGLTAAVYLPWGMTVQAVVSAALYGMTTIAMCAVLGVGGLWSAEGMGALFGTLVVLGNAPVIASTIRRLLIRNAEVEEAKEQLSGMLTKRLEEANRKLERRGIALEEALEEAEKANVSKSRFLASVSHEFRTPLTSIVGFAAMLRNGAAGPVNVKQFDYASEICRSGEHLLQIIEGILTHARVEAEEDPLQLSDVPVDLLVEVACRQVSPAALEKEIVLRRSRPSGCHLIGDKQKLLQVLLNLLSNAIKFSPPRSEIGAEVLERGDAVEIAVWDQGIGLSAANLERIFRPFEQVENSNRTSQKGTGLGLAICKRFVELHGGTIRAESEEGRGSRFLVRLPKNRTGNSHLATAAV
ncbi:MAG: sensor histidine kinase [Candidatus Binatia bacterium]